LAPHATDGLAVGNEGYFAAVAVIVPRPPKVHGSSRTGPQDDSGATGLFAKSPSTAIIQLRPPLSPAFSRASRKFHEIGMAARPIGN
jgi:hypothetical protein